MLTAYLPAAPGADGKCLPPTALPQGGHHVGEVAIIGYFWGLCNSRASERVQLVWAGHSMNTHLYMPIHTTHTLMHTHVYTHMYSQ